MCKCPPVFPQQPPKKETEDEKRERENYAIAKTIIAPEPDTLVLLNDKSSPPIS